MLNLYWKSGDQTRSLVEMPFGSEREFEGYVFEHQDLLGDVYILHRQIRSGAKQGIPDMLGVDQDARICIVEMKNVQVGEDVLPQVLGYAIWAETNPDSIKAIWLECPHKPEDIEIDWDSLDIRLLVIAPEFSPNVLRMAPKIGYPVDLVQVRRFGVEQDEFVLVEVLEPAAGPRPIQTTVMREWDWAFYESEHGKTATGQLRTATSQITKLVEKRSWPISHNLNKYYVGFKLGNRVCFGVSWGGTHAWKLLLKLPEDYVETIKSENWEYQRYDKEFHQAILRPLKPEAPDISDIEHLFDAAYEFVGGRH